MTAPALIRSMDTTAAPTRVHLRRRKNLVEIRWPDGLESQLSGLSLRKSCACSGCTSARQRGIISLIDAEVSIDNLEVHGVSALQFHFSDDHNRGLYPWAYLRQLCEQVA